MSEVRLINEWMDGWMDREVYISSSYTCVSDPLVE